MSWAHAFSILQDALGFADRYVSEHETVADIRRIVDEYIANEGLAETVDEVVSTLANLLHAAAGDDSDTAS